MQTRKHSIIESFANILFGYTVAILSQVIIFPWFNINIPLSDNLLIGFYFSLISIVRSYIIRRWFNRKTVKTIKGFDVIYVDDIRDKPLTQKEKDAITKWWEIIKIKASNRP